ncbi:MAG: anthranilate synthase component I family protein [Methanocorpusculum sp.]|uniref:anthranilate synthase component I family protein n=1 Tax=Methanocorpusculum sp. TaxID=2058474 RepID=UPI002B1FE5E6|nr:anthranilate synthase component I family protein [Methanocorpusculum sp.]MEA5086204.1 anthranilate synthase component I family protein [Methanocorpusculum sp.]
METGIIGAYGPNLVFPSTEELPALKKTLTANTLIPVYTTFTDPGISPASAYEALRGEYGFLLESIEGNERNARYSVLGTGILMHVTADPGISISGKYTPAKGIEGRDVSAESLNDLLRCIEYQSPDIPGYAGGLAGYFSYDLALKTLEVPGIKEKPRDFPLAEFMMPEEYVIFDHVRETITILRFLFGTDLQDIESGYAEALRQISAAKQTLCEPGSSDEKLPCENMGKAGSTYTSCLSETEFEDLVRTAKEYILNGDIFQVVISKQCAVSYEGDPFLIYRQMRRLNPSPYMYFMDFSDKQVIGASPEMLIKVEGRQVTSVPIAGTRKRGKDAQEDEKLEKELLADKKECAEHLMLVDLSRNDIGRVSRYGSVRVTGFMSVEKFSHVQHIVSTVEGVLSDDQTPFDAFMSCFPAGTVSGAPKIRAMQIINELEPTSRGPYAGAVGYIGFNGNLDLAILIRTVVVKDKTAYFQSGAGIVADSNPASEFTESENKAASMKAAIESAGEIS